MNPHVREATEFGRLPMSMCSLDTSVSLLQRLAGDQHDANAWQEFVTRYGGLVLHWARRWGLSGSDAQDVAQEVLLVLVRQIRSFRYDPQRRFRSWLKTIVMRTCTRLRQAELRSEVNGKGGTLHARLLESIEARENLALARAFRGPRGLGTGRATGEAASSTDDLGGLRAVGDRAASRLSGRAGTRTQAQLDLRGSPQSPTHAPRGTR